MLRASRWIVFGAVTCFNVLINYFPVKRGQNSSSGGGDFLSTVLIIRAALYLVIRDVISISVESQPIAWVPFKSSMR